MKVPEFEFEIEIKIKKEYAEIWDPLTEKEYADLKSSIVHSGQHLPIIVNEDGTILDGHHRFKVCNELSIQPKYEIKKFPTELEEKLFVYESNKRRNSTEFQRIKTALKMESTYRELAKRNMSLGGKGVSPDAPLGRVDQKIAELAISSATQVRKVRIILREADQDDLTKVRAGKRTINQVYEHIQKKKIREQRLREAALAEFQSNVKLEGAQIYLGDMFTITPEKIAKNSIPMIFTDPPWPEEYLYLYEQLAQIAFQHLRPQGHLITTINDDYLLEIMEYFKEAGLSYVSHFCIKHEGNHEIDHQKNMYREKNTLLWFVKGDSKKAKGIGKPFSNYFQSKVPLKIEHEWQQSVEEAIYYIEALTVEGEIIFDPFMGSGTTGIAALDLNRRFVGIEKERERYSIAAQRIAKFGS